MQKNKVIIVAGPTASGKSQLAIDLALVLNGVVINADSMQVYKDMPIVSAVPSAEDRAKVEHRLYEIYDPSFRGNVVDWLNRAIAEIRDVWEKGKTPLTIEDLLFYCGYALIDDDVDELRYVKAFMESDAFWYYLYHTSKPYSKGFMALAKNYIVRFSIPSLPAGERRALLAARTPAERNRLVWKAYGIKPPETERTA